VEAIREQNKRGENRLDKEKVKKKVGHPEKEAFTATSTRFGQHATGGEEE